MLKKKRCIIIFVLFFSFILMFNSTSSFAQDPLKKLSRGLLNATLAILEVEETACEVAREENISAGLTYGILKGCFFFLTRTTVGVYEVATFIIPIPWRYEPILKEPEFYPGEGEGLK